MYIQETISAILDSIHNGQDGSIHLVTGEAPTKGFMVGGASWTMTVIPDMLDGYVIADFIRAHNKQLTWDNFYVGWWTHQGRIYFDVAENVDAYSDAMILGQSRKELAVYNVETGISIGVLV